MMLYEPLVCLLGLSIAGEWPTTTLGSLNSRNIYFAHGPAVWTGVRGDSMFLLHVASGGVA